MSNGFYNIRKGINLGSQASDPSGVAGDFYYNSTSNKIRWYNGTVWADIGSGSGSSTGGSGVGDDINALTFKASVTDPFTDATASPLSAVDYSAGKTDTATYDGTNFYHRLNYDASKTTHGSTPCTTTGITLASAPAFTVKIGDVFRFNSEVRRITTVTSQTVFVVDAFTTAPGLSAAILVSQAVHTKDMNAFAGDGLAPSTAFSGNISQVMVTYEDTLVASDIIYDNSNPALIAYTASSDGSNWSASQVRPTTLSDELAVLNLPTSSTNLYLRFFANASSGSGACNILGYKAFFHRDLSSLDGSLLNQAYAFTDGVGTEINCSAPTVVSGKTRLTTTFTFPVAVNSGKTNGSIKVYLNGQKIPRWVDATITPDASYKEISANTIELDGDYSTFNYSLEVIQDVAVVDTADQNSTNIALLQAIYSTVKDTDTTNINSSSMGTTADVWFQPISGLTISLTPGTWIIKFKALQGFEQSGANFIQSYVQFGTSATPGTSLIGDLLAARAQGYVAGNEYSGGIHIESSPIVIGATSSIYVNLKWTSLSGSPSSTSVSFFGARAPTILEAIRVA
jgi:hypothetical protein